MYYSQANARACHREQCASELSNGPVECNSPCKAHDRCDGIVGKYIVIECDGRQSIISIMTLLENAGNEQHDQCDCVIHMSYTCHTHVIHMSYTRHTHFIHTSYTRPTHVIQMSHVIHVSYTCHTDVMHMSFTCHTHVLHMSYTCPTHVMHMSYTRPTHVTHMSYTCPSHVIHMTNVPDSRFKQA